MLLERAITFVMEHGGPVEQAALRFILNGEQPTKPIVEALLAGQNNDGGFPAFWSGGQSSLDATCYRLAQAGQLGLDEANTSVTRALDFLSGRVRTDGSLQEVEELADLAPPWAMPNDLAAILYLTANCGYWLSSYEQGKQNAREAGTFLVKYLDSDGHLPSFLHTHWLAGGLWYRVGFYGEAEVVMRYLQTRLADIAASGLAWLTSTLRLADVPMNNAIVMDACKLLEGQQEMDGRWVSEDGPQRDVSTTLEAIRALLLCRYEE